MRAAKADLQGLFAVYKPPSVSWKLVRDAVETHLLKDLNSLERPAPRQLVRFLPGMVEGEDGKQLTMTVTQVPTLADHPLVSGPAVTHLKVGAGHRLDTRSSGVLVLGVGHGNKLLTDLYNAHLTRTYTVRGLFGKATDDFSDTGKLIEKATFDHITREQLERIVSVIQGSNHKALLQYVSKRRDHGAVAEHLLCVPKVPGSVLGICNYMDVQNAPPDKTVYAGGPHLQSAVLNWVFKGYANIDLKTQEAYELAVRGLIRPMEKTPPLITAVRCIQFAPPEFQLEIHCLHETQQYLRKIVHEIGLEMKSVAVCTQVRRIRDGVFTVDDVLLRTQWNLQNIRNAILKSRHKVETEIQNNLVHEEASTDYEREKETRAGSVVDSTQVREREDALPASSVVKW